MTERHVHVLIEGKVQGVWFRAWTEKTAQEHGLTGWVRNRADGSVEAVFSGPRMEVESMLAACREGPPLARVSRVEAVDCAPPDLRGFEVRRDGAR